MTRWRVLLMLVLTVLGMGWGADALAWWNGDWAFRKEITFDLTPTGADIPGAPTDVPVLIRLSLGNFQYFGDTKPDGSDLRFIAADDKTPLKFHIERFDPQAQIAFVWVRVPHLTGGAKTDKILLYYGNKNAPSAADAGGDLRCEPGAGLPFRRAEGLAAGRRPGTRASPRRSMLKSTRPR